MTEAEAPDDQLRATAIERLRERAEFASHVVAYVVVNAALIAVWAVTGQGYFWPVWVLGGWGIGLGLHAWSTFMQRPITDADVDEEVERLRRRSRRAHSDARS